MKRYLTTYAVARFVDVTDRTVRNWMDRGQLPFVTLPTRSGENRRRVHRHDLRDFLKQNGFHREVAQLDAGEAP